MDNSLEQRLKRLATEVQELKDDREIREVLARYGFNADCDRTEGWVGLFTGDGAMDLGSETQAPGRWVGTEALRKWISTQAARTNPERFGKRLHFQGNNLVCHIKGDTALVNSYSIVLFLIDGKIEVQCGTNLWTFKRVDGKWRIKERLRRGLGQPDYRKMLDATPA